MGDGVWVVARAHQCLCFRMADPLGIGAWSCHRAWQGPRMAPLRHDMREGQLCTDPSKFGWHVSLVRRTQFLDLSFSHHGRLRPVTKQPEEHRVQ